jgi:peptidoglycan/xylan/chitin deacetylase (PgdA/CDA1 family)
MQPFMTLMYHNVIGQGQTFDKLSPSVTSYFVDEVTFERQMHSLVDVADCLALNEVSDFYLKSASKTVKQQRERTGRRQVQITFDDGWMGSVDIAGPILERFGFCGTLFVTTDLIGKPNFVSRSELERLPSGTLSVGSHGRSHRLLSQLDENQIREELVSSKALLEDVLGQEVNSLSIPGGAIDHRVRRIAAESGYRLVFTSEVGPNRRATNPLDLGRVAIKQNTTMKDFHRFVQQRCQRERLRRCLLGIPKRVLGLERYQKLRRYILGEERDQDEMLDLSQCGLTVADADEVKTLENEREPLQC